MTEETANQETEQPQPDEQQQAQQSPPQPDPVQQALEAARESARRAQEEAQRWYQAANQNQYQPPAPDDEDDEDVDEATKKLVDKKVNKVTEQIAQAYQQERQGDLAWREKQERRAAAQELPNWSQYEADIDEYMKNVPLHVRAAEGAYREAYYAIVGRKMTEQAQAEAQRAPQVVSSGRTQAEPEPGPRLGDDQQAFLRESFGISLSDKELETLSRKTVTIDDFEALEGDKR
jgi:hypothetical protein